MQERDLGLIPGLRRSPGGGNGIRLQYSCLENLVDRGAWWATVHGVTKSWMSLKQLSMRALRYTQMWQPGWPDAGAGQMDRWTDGQMEWNAEPTDSLAHSQKFSAQQKITGTGQVTQEMLEIPVYVEKE